MFLPTDHSFIICAYKESKYLESCIQSLQSQTVKTRITISTSTLNAFIEEISKKIIVLNDNISILKYPINKNLMIDRFFIEMWRCKNENS